MASSSLANRPHLRSSLAMRDPHRNIFYYYRGPSKAAAEEAQAHRQIEDNTTKALVNVLEHSDSNLARSFARHFVSALGEDALQESPRFFLQKRHPDPWMPRRRWLIALSPDASVDPKSWGTKGDKGRSDAVIEFPGSAVLAIEVKTAGQLNGAQLLRHAHDWDISAPDPQASEPPPSWLFVTWEDVYRWARSERQKDRSPPSSFLLGQFIEYLEHRGLSPFVGFRPEDFELRGELRGERIVEAKGRLRGFWEEVLATLDPAEAGQLGVPHVGTVGAKEERVWAKTDVPGGGSNLDAQVGKDELVLNLVGWDASQAIAFERWLTSRSADSTLRHLSSHELIVWKRRAMESASGNPFWMHETSSVLERIPATGLAREDRQRKLSLWRDRLEPRWELLAYHVRRTWSAREAVQLGEDLVREFADEVRRLRPILLEINSHATVMS
jgi:hypothetical protein